MRTYRLLFNVIACCFLMFTASCEKEVPETPKQEDTYVQPQAEKVILAANDARAETNGAIKETGYITIYFAEAFNYGGTSYRQVSVEEKYIKSFSLAEGGVSITFKDDKYALLPYQKSVELDIKSTTNIKGYPNESASIQFNVTKCGRGTISFVVQGEKGFTPVVTYDKSKRSGRIDISFNKEQGTTERAVIVVTDGKNKRTYSIEATTYHFTVIAPSSITLGGNVGDSKPFNVSLDTDAPESQLAIKTEGSFFSLSQDNKTVVVVNANATDSKCKGRIILYDGSGHFDNERNVIVTQDVRPMSGGDNCVKFESWNLKNAILGVADTDGDEEISFEEALAVRELVLAGKEISDLTGLEAFKNVWKLDLRDNLIEDATCLKQLPLLYWLDLKGNKKLRTFDVTNCTQYFEHCEFELTNDLSYYTFRQQVGIINASDPDCLRSHHVIDTRTSSDFSRHGRLTSVQKHTKQSGAVPSIVFSGLGYLDIDYQDGSWKRLMDDISDAFWNASPIAEYREYFDVYYIEWVDENRNRYYSPELADHSGAEYKNARKTYEAAILNLQRRCYESVYGSSGEVTQLVIFVNNNPKKNGIFDDTGCVRAAYPPVKVANQYNICLFTHPRIGADLSGVEEEDNYSTNNDCSILPNEFFTNPIYYNDYSRDWDRKFLRACGF